jgi:hypothetical protein
MPLGAAAAWKPLLVPLAGSGICSVSAAHCCRVLAPLEPVPLSSSLQRRTTRRTLIPDQGCAPLLSQAMCSLLFLACIALALPTASRQLYPGSEFSHKDLLSISHGTAVMLVIV